MGLPEKLALLRFHHHGNCCSLNNILYQLGIINGETADKRNKEHFYKALEALNFMSEEDRANLK